ncbi:conserved hypothetical protein [delta proteobacterium NaphS2]|nr:conserved hypothetical protein [delta proteobacterium NaphS2]
MVVSLYKAKYPQVIRRGAAILMDQKQVPMIKINLDKAKISTGALHVPTDNEMLAIMDKHKING